MGVALKKKKRKEKKERGREKGRRGRKKGRRNGEREKGERKKNIVNIKSSIGFTWWGSIAKGEVILRKGAEGPTVKLGLNGSDRRKADVGKKEIIRSSPKI